MLPDKPFFKACEIYSNTELPELPAKKGVRKRVRRFRPARHGILPISRSQFYDWIDKGRFPAADSGSGDTPFWSRELLIDHLTVKPEPDK